MGGGVVRKKEMKFVLGCALTTAIALDFLVWISGRGMLLAEDFAVQTSYHSPERKVRICRYWNGVGTVNIGMQDLNKCPWMESIPPVRT